ncbi:MAG: TonB-dependent receptor plug domain-containing protein, partial [Opitutaceae bacterium]
MKPARLFPTASLLVTLCAALAAAQTVPPAPTPPAGADTVTLSPFVVNTTGDTGYAATSTLSGSRLNTELKDVAAQVSVFTQELLNDLAATNIEQAFLYSSNTETYFNNYSVDGDYPGIDAGTRVRGLGSASALRGMFPTFFQTDTYNIERITLSSGPNSILFGLGNSAGSFDSTLKQANFRRKRGDFGLRFDSFGSKRESLDVNQVLIDKKLAVRLAALNDETNFFRKPSFDDSRRLFATVTAQPFEKTVVRASAEWIHRNAAKPSLTLPRDLVTPWIAAGRPAYDNRQPTSATASNVLKVVPANQRGFIAPNNDNRARYVYMYGATAGTPGLFPTQGDVVTIGPNFLMPQTFDQTFLYSLDREDLVPYRKVNNTGRANEDRQQGRAVNLELEQRITKDFGVQIAYAREDSFLRSGGFSGGGTNQFGSSGTGQAEVFADANQYIRTANLVLINNAQLNPNFGKLYLDQSPGENRSIGQYDEFRVTGAYRLDFTKQKNIFRWLGTHQFSSVYSTSLRDQVSQGTKRYIEGKNSTNFVPATDVAFQKPTNNNRAYVTYRYYLDSPADPASQGRYSFDRPAGVDVFETQTFTDPYNGATLRTYLFDNPNGTYTSATLTRSRVISRMIASQSYFLKNRVILFYGLRKDVVSLANGINKDPNAPNQLVGDRIPDSYNTALNQFYAPYWQYRFAGYNFTDSATKANSGLVVRPLPWLSTHLSRSENYKVDTAGAFDPYNVRIPSGVGKSEDYGFTVATNDNRFSVRLNFFKNTQLNNTAPSSLSAARSALYNIEKAIEDYDQSVQPNGVSPRVLSGGQYRLVSDAVSRGFDAQLTANLGGWRIFFTAGRQNAVTTNIATSWDVWSKARAAELWQPGTLTKGG